MMAGGGQTGGEHTVQYTDEVLQICTPETYIMLLQCYTDTFSSKKFK